MTVYISFDIRMKPVVFLGDSLDRLRDFPERPRRDAGFQLDRVHVATSRMIGNR
jgi:phage-related protein